jgi:2-phospho-L-lactate guanylyltransferase
MTGCTALVPVKPWHLSQSRLDVPLQTRARLVRAFALDLLETVSGASGVDQVVIITAELELGGIARRLDAVLLADRPMLSTDGLNVALDAGRWWAAARRPQAPVVVIPADMPALTADVLDQTLGLMARSECAFVPDAAGRGTTLYRADSPRQLRFEYGSLSASRHSDLGARAVPEADPRARWDVDNAHDLAETRRLGVGRYTVAALREFMEDSGSDDGSARLLAGG